MANHDSVYVISVSHDKSKSHSSENTKIEYIVITCLNGLFFYHGKRTDCSLYTYEKSF
jgi:hypothetical protein